MIDLEQIRIAQEQRLIPVMKAWDEAKQQIEDAIARAEACEKEFRDVSEDVRRNLSALELVGKMAAGGEARTHFAQRQPVESNRPRLMAAEEISKESRAEDIAETVERSYGGLLRRTSRPLFTNVRKTA